jgi:hypothetical protein
MVTAKDKTHESGIRTLTEVNLESLPRSTELQQHKLLRQKTFATHALFN